MGALPVNSSAGSLDGESPSKRVLSRLVAGGLDDKPAVSRSVSKGPSFLKRLFIFSLLATSGLTHAQDVAVTAVTFKPLWLPPPTDERARRMECDRALATLAQAKRDRDQANALTLTLEGMTSAQRTAAELDVNRFLEVSIIEENEGREFLGHAQRADGGRYFNCTTLRYETRRP